MSFYAYFRLADGRFQERFGLDFEEFQPGQVFRHRPGVTVSQQDNTDEALDTMNGAMLHFDANYAAKTVWQRPLMVSTITLQRMVGMGSKTFGRRRVIREIKEIALTKPVFGGDTLYAESRILTCDAAAADPDCGTLTIAARAVTGEGVEVARMTYLAEIYRRGLGPDAGLSPAAEDRFAAWRQDGAAYIEQVGLFFEDFAPNETFVHAPRRTFYWREGVEHAWRSLEINPRFHDLHWIAENCGGRQQIAETFVITAATTPTTRTFGRVVANLGWVDIKLPTPVLAGDTVESESTVVDKRESKSRPNEGILTVDTRSYNQRRDLVLSYRRTLLVYRRAGDSPYAAAGY